MTFYVPAELENSLAGDILFSHRASKRLAHSRETDNSMAAKINRYVRNHTKSSLVALGFATALSIVSAQPAEAQRQMPPDAPVVGQAVPRMENAPGVRYAVPRGEPRADWRRFAVAVNINKTVSAVIGVWNTAA